MVEKRAFSMHNKKTDLSWQETINLEVEVETHFNSQVQF